MLFRTVLISLVLGTTILLSWLSDVDLASPSSLVLFLIIGTTYLLTLVYALAVRFEATPQSLGTYQLAGDLAITTILVHVTGGAQSAFTFFFPLSIIGGAILYYRRGALIVSLASLLLLVTVALLGWSDLLPMPGGSRVLPADQTALSFARSLGLNVAAIIGLSILAISLGSQLQRASLHIESQRSVAADILSLHQDIVRSLSSGLITLDSTGQVLTANRAASEILRRPATDLVGSNIDDIVPDLAPKRADSEPGRKDVARRELQRELGGATQTLGVSVSPLFDRKDEEIGRVINFQDLTELRRMEMDIKRSERLAAIGELAAGVAHEIRNPLASISGSIELLSLGPEADDDSKALMGIIIREIERLNGLINDLLDYTNPRPAELSTVELRSLCEETIQVFQQDKDFEAVTVSFDSKPEEVEVKGDPEKLRQVIWNLVRNGAEAATHGGKQVRVQLAKRNRAEIHVIDNGPGIAPAQIPRIFDPFFTTKNRGSGLGLAVVHSIVENHGGKISVTSEVGEGCDFKLEIPLQTSSLENH